MADLKVVLWAVQMAEMKADSMVDCWVVKRVQLLELLLV
jgi:hypothetical protein